uniref:SHSP domain-containing protein n=1 Tax=Kalanchoe fedtschenkoi TaxID=63787 RepID=A0A7N0TET1_KALFE
MIRSGPSSESRSNLILISIVLSGFLCMLCTFNALYIPVSAMEGHHLLGKRSLAEAVDSANRTLMFGFEARKKLRRLPHVFSRVLELPLKSDADVSIEVNPSYFRFVVDVGDDVCGVGRRVGAHMIQVCPGVVKVVVRGDVTGKDDDALQRDGLELDKWRFRLPLTTRLDRTTIVCVDGELVVTVPKDPSAVVGDGVEGWSGSGRRIELL